MSVSYTHLSTLREENDFIVRANPYLLGIALQNVVDNACKYSDKDVEISLFEKEGDVYKRQCMFRA